MGSKQRHLIFLFRGWLCVCVCVLRMCRRKQANNINKFQHEIE